MPIDTPVVNPEDLLPSDAENAKLLETTEHPRRVYTLTGDPEIVAVAFAKCSRSPKPFDENLEEVSGASAAEFHEKWVVGYGHGSVAEHATLHVAFENVSNIAVKIIEDNRLGSYTEKSTRYQVIDKHRYVTPTNVATSPFGARYKETIDHLFDVYASVFEPLTAYMQAKFPKSEKASPKLYAAQTKARVCDVARYLLPAATMTNLGMTANARAFEWAITKGLSNPLEEVRAMAAELKEACLKVTPTLVKYADPNAYLQESRAALQAVTDDWISPLPSPDQVPPVAIVDYEQHALEKIVAALLYKHSNHPFAQIFERVKVMPREEKERIIHAALSSRGPHDQPVREFEHASYTFDILMDYGAWRDVQRHRMASQTNQNVTTAHGYIVPEEITAIGKEAEYRAALEKARDLHDAMIAGGLREEAQYVVPMGYKKRVLMTWNLRELHHFIPLRSGKKGHPSYRLIAQQCWQEVERIHPFLASFIRVDMSQEHVSTIGTKVKSDAAIE